MNFTMVSLRAAGGWKFVAAITTKIAYLRGLFGFDNAGESVRSKFCLQRWQDFGGLTFKSHADGANDRTRRHYDSRFDSSVAIGTLRVVTSSQFGTMAMG